MTITYAMTSTVLLICLTLMLVDAGYKLRGSEHRKISLILIGTAMLYIASDCIWIVEYTSETFHRDRFIVYNFVFYSLYITLPYIWFLFAKHFSGSRMNSRKWHVVFALPWAFNACLVLLTAAGPPILWEIGDAATRYTRGPLFGVFTKVCLVYYFIPVGAILFMLFTGRGNGRRTLLTTLGFSLIPALGVFIYTYWIPVEAIYPFQPCCFFIGVMFAYILLLAEVSKKAEDENIRLAERARAAEQLADVMGSVGALLTNMPALTFSKDAESGRYLACNQSFAEYAGKSRPEEVVGLRAREIFDAETAGRLEADDAGALAQSSPYICFEDVPDASGELHHLQTTRLQFEDASGRKCVLGMCVDVTEMTKIKAAEAEGRARQEELEQRLALQDKLIEQSEALKDALETAQQASRAKTAFLSNMSHEIRTPMNAIIGLNNIVLNDPETPPKTKEYLEKIATSANHLLGIINDILDMSRIESGRMVIRSEEFCFPRMLEQVNTMIGGQCRDKGLSYDCRVCGKLSDWYIGDDMKLRQVLINILGNAVKFTEKGGTVTLLVEETARFEQRSTLRFVISDTGIGMSPEFLPHIFDAFAQEDSSATNRFGSTGLGMPISRSIIELMNGSIQVESEKGKGTTFTVDVTLTVSEHKAGDEDGTQLPEELNILVIDDDKDELEQARIVLGQAGMSCHTASSGEEGLEAVRVARGRCQAYDLILIDWQMPGMDGLETARRIRDAIGDGSAIILLTAYSWEEIEGEAKEAGIDSLVSKPLSAETVLDEFSDAFAVRSRAQRTGKADLAGRRVLLAEDMEVNAEIMMMVLSMREMKADLAENGRIAVEKFAASMPGYYDAVLMDMRMPEMNGLEAARAIRAMDREDAQTVPIIALTANAFDEDVQRSMQAGLNAHLSKPVEPDKLFATLEGLIRD